MSRRYMMTVLCLVAAAAPLEATAQTARCDALPPPARDVARKVLATTHLYDCCDQTIARCLEAKPVCPLALRLADDVCRMATAGKSQTEIERGIVRRAESMMPLVAPAAIALDETARAGEAAAPVAVVAYACARCPFCSKLVPALYREVTQGALRGKVRLYVRPFPLKDHTGSIEGGQAMLAAAGQGRFWPYLLQIYARYHDFRPDLLAAWAEEQGMDRAAFEAVMRDPATRQSLVSSKQEGVRNHVTATPTLFINGRRYVYELEAPVIVDVLCEEHERVTGTSPAAR